jgi:hypothetical protein
MGNNFLKIFLYLFSSIEKNAVTSLTLYTLSLIALFMKANDLDRGHGSGGRTLA